MLDGIDNLIIEAKELKQMNYNSPRVALWEKRARDFISQNYGSECEEIFDRAIFFGQVIMSEAHGQRMHEEALSKAVELLDSLKSEPKMESSHKNASLSQNDRAKTSTRFESLTISGGNVFFGDGNTLTQVYVKDVVEALSKEIQERIPESEVKNNVLDGLKELTTNETFAAVTGSFVGEVLKSLVR